MRAGRALSAATVPELRCAAVVGSANNQLASPEDGQRLAAAGILYAADFVVNAGGLISVADELTGWDERRVSRLPETLRAVLDHAAATGRTSDGAAEALAGAPLSDARVATTKPCGPGGGGPTRGGSLLAS